ncbi:MAG TPA: alanine--tRNA ligase-related protein [Candidatus Limnocylindria bacterium]|nr:alanine--tRNA ligase-related protein [Candidatus Limnocylindria bacterium]
MATELVYLQDFEVTTCDATVQAAEGIEEGAVDIQLDQTCFYPRGGGQDWDTGTIKSADDSAAFAVREVRLDEHGTVHHIGTVTAGTLKAGDRVSCSVDPARRMINTRLHSAGHTVDLAVDRLKLPLTPVRGGHYPHMSFVEYEGTVEPEQAEEIRQKVEAIVHEVIDKGSENEIRFMPVSEMHTVCRHVPPNIPANKPARVVIYDGTFGVPCGGTHVKNVHDIGQVHVTKLKTKKGLTKVSYTVEGIN